MFLGGPLHYCRTQKALVETLTDIGDGAVSRLRLAAALGAAMYIRDGKTVSCDQLIRSLEDGVKKKTETKRVASVCFKGRLRAF